MSRTRSIVALDTNDKTPVKTAAINVQGLDQKIAGLVGVMPDQILINDVIVNPTMLVEVLSTSTEPYDRGLKWEGYQRISTLSDYVLVSQDEPRIEHYLRGPAGSWIYRSAGPGGRVTLSNGAVLEVDVLFEGAFEIPGD